MSTATETVAPMRHRATIIENDLRTRAEAAGRPILRTSFSPFVAGLTQSKPIILSSDRRGRPMVAGVKIDPEQFSDMLEDGTTMLAPSALSLHKISHHYFGLGTSAGYAAARQIRASLALPVQTRLMPVTDALKFLYWTAPGFPEDDLRAWAGAFGVRGSGEDLLMQRLMGHLAPSELDEHTSRHISTKLRALESEIVTSSRYASLRSGCRVYSKMNTHRSMLDGLLLADPALYGLNNARGAISRSEIVQVRSSILKVRIEGSLKYKPGSSVRLIGGPLSAKGEPKLSKDLSIRDIVSRGGGYDVHLSGKTQKISEDFQDTGFTPYLAPALFLGSSRKSVGDKWFSHQAPKIETSVDVPLDVALAGGPIEDQA